MGDLMADPFDWSPRNLGPSREERAAAASARALPRRGYTYAANDGLTDRQRRQSFAAQRREHRRQQRERHRRTMAEARESDRARRRARRDAGEVGGAADNYRDAADRYKLIGVILIAAFAFDAFNAKRGRRWV
jgi:hypothetical protein